VDHSKTVNVRPAIANRRKSTRKSRPQYL